VSRRHRDQALLVVVLALVGAAAALSWMNARSLTAANDRVTHTHEVEKELEALAGALVEVESGARGYGLSGDPALLPQARHGEAAARSEVDQLRRLTADNPRQQERVGAVESKVVAKIAFNEQIISARDAEGVDAAARIVASRQGLDLMDAVQGLLASMRGEEEALLQERTTRMKALRRRTTIFAVSVIGLLLGVLAVLWSLARAEAKARKTAAAKVRQSEERMRLLLGAVRDYSILELDPSGRVARWSSAAEKMFGYPEHEVVGTDAARFNPTPADARREREEATRSGRFEDEGRRLRKDGTSFWADVVTTAIRGEDGELRGFAKVVRDVTRRHELDAALRESARKLEASNRELQDFAMVASHDLQEPLRKVQMFGDKLMRNYSAALGSEGSDYLRRMMNAAERGQSLIQGLLAFSRVTTKGQRPVRVDLEATVREVVSDLEARLSDVRGTVEIGRLPSVDADPLQMRQLLQNLIGNALKFRKPALPPVVRVAGADHDGETACFEVSDNGIGFDQKYVDRIFKLFQRLHERGAYEGSGMGLAICRKIVERHGGTITARSAPGEGATFVINLPRTSPHH